MSLASGDGTGSSQPPFWDRFEPIVPQAVRCRFFSRALGILGARAREYSRESGPFVEAVTETHLPVAIQRLQILKRDAELLATCYDDTANARGESDEAFRIVAKFETEIVDPLDRARSGKDESGAREVISSLRRVAPRIARIAEAALGPAVDELEQAVVGSVLSTERLTGFVSCVSLDLARYGAHAATVSDYTKAPGLLEFNQMIHERIDAAVLRARVPADEVIRIDTGDGAILLFTTSSSADGKAAVATRAYNVSVEFMRALARENSSIALETQLHFRIGICSGAIALVRSQLRRSGLVGCRAAGLPIGTAVRLQAAARTGEIVACTTTVQLLPTDADPRPKAAESIFGKTHEKKPIEAHRIQCAPPHPDEREVASHAPNPPSSGAFGETQATT